ncbi:hypothetical protein ACJZ2D_011776 [Fusarium nematophilum]
MTNSQGPVTEFVLNPIGVPVEDFMRTFTQQLEPTLLAQPGIISVQTGVVISTSSPQHPGVVSLTLWESLEAHQAFLDSPAFGPFISTVQPLLRGPPTIEHYHLGQSPSSALKSRYSRIFSLSGAGEEGLQSISTNLEEKSKALLASRGNCVEVPSKGMIVLFKDSSNFEGVASSGEGSEGVESFTVEWLRAETKRLSSSL